MNQAHKVVNHNYYIKKCLNYQAITSLIERPAFLITSLLHSSKEIVLWLYKICNMVIVMCVSRGDLNNNYFQYRNRKTILLASYKICAGIAGTQGTQQCEQHSFQIESSISLNVLICKPYFLIFFMSALMSLLA